MPPIIEVTRLSKTYRLGERVSYHALRDSFTHLLRHPLKTLFNPRPADDLWALRDISFAVQPGEVMGIIGPNGAGKSTLLKILSRITLPTSGRAVLRGRIASLLEVGTGFHQELTGRENIYLNGAILGMTKKEISRKFGQIVEFSGVKPFLDTPVKHYSSGMRVRLAFAVAAHLDPEILLIDEVLAVGDAEFQKKCLHKMEDIVKDSRRTILFVSHNLPAVVQLCARSIYLEGGRIKAIGSTPEVVNRYTTKYISQGKVALAVVSGRRGSGSLRLKSLAIRNQNNQSEIHSLDRLLITAELDKSLTSQQHLRLVLGFYDPLGVGLFRLDTGSLSAAKLKGKKVFISTGILNLTPVECWVNYSLFIDGILTDHAKKAARFSLLPTGQESETTNHQFATTIIDHQVISYGQS